MACMRPSGASKSPRKKLSQLNLFAMADLKLVSYNIHKGILKEEILQNLQNFKELGVGIFCLQELRLPKTTGEQFMGETILQHLGPGWQAEFFLGDRANSPDCGLGIFWQDQHIEPISFQKLFLPRLGDDLTDDKLSAISKLSVLVHPIQRASLIGTFRIHGHMMRISNVHLHHIGGFRQRLKEFKHLVENLKSNQHQGPEIICGDFNTLGVISNAKQIREIEKLLGEEFINTSPDFQITTSHFQHLDHVFTRNIKATDTKVYQWPGSDHYPVMVSLGV